MQFPQKIDFEVKAVIFDVDVTIQNNKPNNDSHGLHERTRYMAVREVGRLHNIQALKDFSLDDTVRAFRTAAFPTLQSAIWNSLLITGQVQDQVMDKKNELFQEIYKLKNEFFEKLLLKEGEAVPGSIELIKALAENGLKDRFAIASMAMRKDVIVFLNKMELSSYFPDSRIKTQESIVHPKPNPEIFNLAFSSLNLPEEDRIKVCVFEDDPKGIISAKTAGLYVCGIGTRYSPEQLMALETPPHIAFKTFAEYLDWFNFQKIS